MISFQKFELLSKFNHYVNQQGTIAQLVEQWLEAPCVVGSIPAHAISGRFQPDNLW